MVICGRMGVMFWDGMFYLELGCNGYGLVLGCGIGG